MEPIIMYGKPVVEKMLEGGKWNPETTLYILSNQDDAASVTYVNNKRKKCEEVGVKCVVYDISKANISRLARILEDCLYGDFRKYVIVQKPLPKQLKTVEPVIDRYFAEHPWVDIDAFDGGLTTEFKTPCTPLGIMKMLDYYIGIDKLDGMNAVVIGRSKIVGAPMARLLERANCTVTICHSHTSEEDLKFYTQHADIIISAVGKLHLITAEYINAARKPIIVDVGMNRDENGKLCGDVDLNGVLDRCRAISPVPGGVGPLTVASIVYKMREAKNR